MKRFVFLLAWTAVTLVLASGTTRAQAPAVTPHDAADLEIGKEAPDIEGEDVDGIPFRLSDYRGKSRGARFLGRLVTALPGHVPTRAVARTTAGQSALCPDRHQQRSKGKC